MKLKTKNVHLAIILIGILFNCISIFHSNIWFDEAYSVGLANKSFVDIWKIGGNDVHPILYYWILHIIYLITNAINMGEFSIIAYRIFSAVCISLLGILGFSHIRKDFREKTGLLFTFFAYFLPATCIYTAEVRMYSLAILLVSVLAIYGYRIAKQANQENMKNWLIFGFTSLACIYTHYYGLMAAGIINVILLGYLIKEKRTASVIKILVSGVIQLIAYIPWLMYFLKQLKQVSKGFWIGFEFPKTLIEILSSQYIGNLTNALGTIGFVISILIYLYIGYRIYKTIKDKKDYKIAICAISIYLAVIIAAVAMTAVLRTSILYYRYLFVITGLLIFFISYFLAEENNKYIVYTICGITIMLAAISNYNQIKEAYGTNNMTQISYIKENIQENDVIFFGETQFGSGTVVGLGFLDHNQYYYNPSNWGVEEAYKAFGPQLKIHTDAEFLNQINERIWIIDSENEQYYNELFNNENYKLISKKLIRTEYQGYSYNLILVERMKR